MPSTPSNKSLAKAVIIFGGAQIITILAALLRSKVAAITVGATGVGLTSLYLAISGLVNNICNLGLPDSGVQVLSKAYASGDNENISKTIGLIRLWELICATAAILLTIVFAPLLCLLYFSDINSHLHSIFLLSLAPAATIVTALEMVILKCMQATRQLTTVIIINAIITVIVAIPLYVLLGWNGIIFIIVLTQLLSMGVTTFITHKLNSTPAAISKLHSISSLWKDSRPMLLLGMTLIITGIGSMGTEFLLQTYFAWISSLAVVGLYKAGYQLSITYPGLIFTALSNDYYPRLSALQNDTNSRNVLATKQTRVLVLIATPCIILFIILLPWIVPLLLSDEFTKIIPFVSIGALGIIIKCLSMPLCYMPLALGRSKDFICMELATYLALFVCVVVSCHIAHFEGIGYGIVASCIFDYLYALILCRVKYGFRYTLKQA